MIKPYYDHAGITIYHGDCLEILPQFDQGSVDVILTDPIWPNACKEFKHIESYKLFEKAASYFPGLSGRLLVWLGCDSDPRFLRAVPKEYEFLRVCWLRRIPPKYKGSILYGADVAYVFGPEKGI